MKRHINTQYYFITDRIIKKEATVEFTPTLDMIENYFTKELQGSKLCRFRNIIIGIHEDYIPAYNEYGGSFIEEKKLKLKKEKEESQRDEKLAGN